MTVDMERHYKRLLWAYPGSYRRRHGAEIVTTLLEMAEAGHGRPTAAQTLHLLVCGLRQRFRLPARRPLAWVAAVLAAIAVGSAGATAGTWVGWQTAADTPTHDQLRDLTTAVSGGLTERTFEAYRSAMQGPGVTSIATGRGDNAPERARAALTAAGWRVTSLAETDVEIVTGFATEEDPATGVNLFKVAETKPGKDLHVTATQGGRKLSGFGTISEGQGFLRLDAWAAETAAVRPLTVAGLLLGMLTGWLLTAAVAYRTRGRSRPRRWVVALLGTTAFAAAALPVYQLYRDAYQVMVYATGSPNPYIVGSAYASFPTRLVIASIGALAAAVLVAALRSSRMAPAAERTQ